MARNDEFRPSNPTSQYYDWDQVEKTFSYWDFTTQERVPVPLPFKFLVLRQRAIIMGFTEDDNKDRIYSNELKESEVGRAEFTVRTKEKILNRGIWKDIKDVVKAIGGSYFKIIHAVSMQGEVICIRIKGNSLRSWGDIVGLRKHEERLRDELIIVDGYDKAEFQDDFYSFPTFKFGGTLTPAQNSKADNLYNQLERYCDFRAASYQASQQQPAVQPQQQPRPITAPAPSLVLDPAAEDDDLPF